MLIRHVSKVTSGPGFLYASFGRDVTLSYTAPTEEGPLDVTNDLATESYFALLAAGRLDDDTDLPDKHEEKEPSPQAFDFLECCQNY